MSATSASTSTATGTGTGKRVSLPSGPITMNTAIQNKVVCAYALPYNNIETTTTMVSKKKLITCLLNKYNKLLNQIIVKYVYDKENVRDRFRQLCLTAAYSNAIAMRRQHYLFQQRSILNQRFVDVFKLLRNKITPLATLIADRMQVRYFDFYIKCQQRYYLGDTSYLSERKPFGFEHLLKKFPLESPENYSIINDPDKNNKVMKQEKPDIDTTYKWNVNYTFLMERGGAIVESRDGEDSMDYVSNTQDLNNNIFDTDVDEIQRRATSQHTNLPSNNQNNESENEDDQSTDENEQSEDENPAPIHNNLATENDVNYENVASNLGYFDEQDYETPAQARRRRMANNRHVRTLERNNMLNNI